MGRARVTKIEFHSKGFEAILKSPRVLADIEARTGRVAAAAGDGMTPSTMIGRTRARGSVITGSTEAMRAEAQHKRLTSAIGAGRG